MIDRLVALRVAMISFLAVLMLSCNSQNNRASYEEISYHQESFFLFELLNYYEEDFGGYPSDLDELVKLFPHDSIEYSGINKSNIESKIKDPFSLKNYKYLLLGSDSFLLYSVGADGEDDNSSILSKYKDTGSIEFKHYDQQLSSGDILIYRFENGKVINDLTDVSNLR